jgi:hypothetical protein
MAQDHDRVVVRAVLGTGEVSAQRRTHAERREEAGGHPLARDALRGTTIVERDLPVAGRRGALEGARLPREVDIGQKTEIARLPLGVALANEHESIGARVRQRPKENRVGDAEDGRRRADA